MDSVVSGMPPAEAGGFPLSTRLVRMWREALDLLAAAGGAGLLLSEHTHSTLMSALRKANRPDKALEVFHRLRKRGLAGAHHPSCYTLAVCCAADQRRFALARSLLAEARADGAATPAVYGAAADAAARAGDARGALALVREMQRAEVPLTVEPVGAAIKACMDRGLWREALGLLQLLAERDVPGDRLRCFNMAIAACGKAGKWREALKLLELLKKAAATEGAGGNGRGGGTSGPDLYSYGAALAACARADRVEEVQALQREMEKNKLSGNLVTYNAVASVHRRRGNYRAILGLMVEMRKKGIQPDDADFITLHTPLTPDTRNLIDKDSIAQMKDNVRIINCARGGIINEADLVEALDAGKVAGAAMDVYETEPPAGAGLALVAHPKVTCTPHLGASTDEAQINVARDVAQQMCATLAGQEYVGVLNVDYMDMANNPRAGPFVALGEMLGKLAVQKFGGAGRAVVGLEVQAWGEHGVALGAASARKLLRAVILKGMLSKMEGVPAAPSLINAPLLAEQLGLRSSISEARPMEGSPYTNLVSAVLTLENGETHVLTGSVFGQEPHLVQLDGYRSFPAFRPSGGTLLTFVNDDRPGAISEVLELLGAESVNVAGMALGRQDRAQALCLMDLDSAPSPACARALQVTYTEAMAACSRAGEYRRALTLWQDMRDLGLPLGRTQYGAAMSALAGLRHWREVLALIKEMKERGLTPEERQYRSALTACQKARQWDTAVLLLEQMRRDLGRPPGLAAHVSVITTCVQAQRGEEGYLLFRHMVDRERTAPTGPAFSIALLACRVWGRGDRAVALLREMAGPPWGLAPTPSCFKYALEALAENENWGELIKVTEYAIELGVDLGDMGMVFEIQAHGKLGNEGKALAILHSFRKKHGRVSADMLEAVTEVLLASQKFEQAFALVDNAKEEFNCVPRAKCYSSLLQYAVQLPKLEDTEEIYGRVRASMKQQGVRPSTELYQMLLTVLDKLGFADRVDKVYLEGLQNGRVNPWGRYEHNSLFLVQFAPGIAVHALKRCLRDMVDFQGLEGVRRYHRMSDSLLIIAGMPQYWQRNANVRAIHPSRLHEEGARAVAAAAGPPCDTELEDRARLQVLSTLIRLQFQNQLYGVTVDDKNMAVVINSQALKAWAAAQIHQKAKK